MDGREGGRSVRRVIFWAGSYLQVCSLTDGEVALRTPGPESVRQPQDSTARGSDASRQVVPVSTCMSFSLGSTPSAVRHRTCMRMCN